MVRVVYAALVTYALASTLPTENNDTLSLLQTHAELALGKAPMCSNYVLSQGVCSGTRTKYDDRDCQSKCDADSSCTAYLMAPNYGNWCQTYATVGVTGNGNPEHGCYIKTETPTTLTYVSVEGVCSGTRLKFDDRSCESRCSAECSCTAYLMGPGNENWCQTYATVGVTGAQDYGDGDFQCHIKQELTTTTTTTSSFPLDEDMSDEERHIEISDEREGRRECEKWCYSKQHKGKDWVGHKCNWNACMTCPECEAA